MPAAKDWPKEGLRRPDGAPACGAKTKSGTPCFRIPAHGQKRCRHHGGLSFGKDAKALLFPGQPEIRSRTAVRYLEREGLVKPEDPLVLDMRHTVASMLSLVDLARPIVADDTRADELMAILVDKGLDPGSDFAAMIREVLQELKFDRLLRMVDRLAKVGAVQASALRVQQVGQLILQHVLPTMADFSHRLAAAAERYIPADQHDAWRQDARRIMDETRDTIVRRTAEAQGVTGGK